MSRRRFQWIGGFAALALLAIASWAAWSHQHAGNSGLPYHDHFASGSLSEWTVFGGSWQVMDGVLQNNSDDTGTKLITGSPTLRDYKIDTDVQLVNHFGDAGVMLRVQHPEEGTDAFLGYYIGLRLPGQLLFGRMDYGYVLVKQQMIAGGVQPGVWYHLSAAVRGCTVQAQVYSAMGSPLARVEGAAPECMPTGRFGLRSFAAGGAWRNVHVEALP